MGGEGRGVGGGGVGVQKCKWLQGGETRFPKVSPKHKQRRSVCRENSPSINSVHIEIRFSTKKAPKKVMMYGESHCNRDTRPSVNNRADIWSCDAKEFRNKSIFFYCYRKKKNFF